MHHEEIGQHERVYGINKMFDPEKYVDSDVELFKRKIDASNYIRNWTLIDANVSPEMYFVYQEWNDRFKEEEKKKKTDRNYSFLGLYRKFSIADVFDLMDLDEKRERAERDIEIVTYFASFYGNSIFTIFYNDLRMLKWIADQL